MKKMKIEHCRKLLVQILFWIYCLFLIYAILFKFLAFSFEDVIWMFQNFHPTFNSLNLIPFHYDREIGTYFHITEILENILIFVPFGMLLKILNINNKKIVLLWFFSSFVLELCQFLFRIGSADITDLITNTLWTFLGIMVYVLFLKIFKTKGKTDKILTILTIIWIVVLLIFILMLKIYN